MQKHSTQGGAARMLFAGLLALATSGFGAAAWAGDGFSAAPISDAELTTQRGREGASVLDITAAINQLDGNLTDNVATGNTNGGNVIRDAAFSNLNGHVTVIQNSGNNNIIQDSTIYNFSFHP